MSRPKITIDMLGLNYSIFYEAIKDTAKPDDFKAIFEAQAFNGEYSLNSAIKTLYSSNDIFNTRIIDHVNSNLRYGFIMAQLLVNKQYFKNVKVPTRDADFMMSDVVVGQEVYFWIEERLEITLDLKTHKTYLAKLMVDDKSDSLLFHNGEDAWIEYGTRLSKHHKYSNKSEEMIDFGDKVAIKYKEFLAEQQLLK